MTAELSIYEAIKTDVFFLSHFFNEVGSSG